MRATQDRKKLESKASKVYIIHCCGTVHKQLFIVKHGPTKQQLDPLLTCPFIDMIKPIKRKQHKATWRGVRLDSVYMKRKKNKS